MTQRLPMQKMTQSDFDHLFEEHKKQGLQFHFANCDLNGLDLSDKKLASIIFENCNLNDVNLSGTVIEKGEFRNCLLMGVNFEKADLVSVEFIGCAMQKVNLSHVKIEGVGIKESNLSHASLKSTEVGFSDSNIFEDVNLRGADLSGSKLGWVSGAKINFEYANLNNSSICESQLVNCNFMNASLANSELYSVAFVDCAMERSTLATSKIENVMFKESILKDADFTEAEIGYGSFQDSNLDGANFREAALHSVNEFRNVSMQETDFTDATFSEESKMYDVDVLTVKGLQGVVPENAKEVFINESAEILVPRDKEQLAQEEYQRQVTLFTALYVSSEVNADVDGKIALAMLQQGYPADGIITAIASHSPHALKRVPHAGNYATNVVRKAERQNTIRR